MPAKLRPFMFLGSKIYYAFRYALGGSGGRSRKAIHSVRET
jgi:hypothetical protein